MTTDGELLRRYMETHSEDAFAELVKRHLDLVYSTALRRLNGDAHLAQDVAQLVFTDLARKGASLAGRPALAGWLYTGAHFAAAKAVRAARRRDIREQAAQAMQALLHDPGPSPGWEALRPVLDAAMHDLNEADREMILLRYFENRPHAEIGEQFGLSENTTRMRVERALEKLRTILGRRGVTTTAAVSAALSANAVMVAPAGLASTIGAASALAGTTLATTTSAAAIAANEFKTIAMTTIHKSLIATAIAVAAVAGLYEFRQTAQLRVENRALQQHPPQTEQILQLQQERDEASNRAASLTERLAKADADNLELMRLRGELGSLRRQLAESPSVISSAGSPSVLVSGIIEQTQLNNSNVESGKFEFTFDQSRWRLRTGQRQQDWSNPTNNYSDAYFDGTNVVTVSRNGSPTDSTGLVLARVDRYNFPRGILDRYVWFGLDLRQWRSLDPEHFPNFEAFIHRDGSEFNNSLTTHLNDDGTPSSVERYFSYNGRRVLIERTSFAAYRNLDGLRVPTVVKAEAFGRFGYRVGNGADSGELLPAVSKEYTNPISIVSVTVTNVQMMVDPISSDLGFAGHRIRVVDFRLNDVTSYETNSIKREQLSALRAWAINDVTYYETNKLRSMDLLLEDPGIRSQMKVNASIMERERQAALSPAKSEDTSSTNDTAAIDDRPFPRDYNPSELFRPINALLGGGRDFERGQKLFTSQNCAICHRFGEEPGGIGPDITGIGGRMNTRELLESVIQPSKIIGDLYSLKIYTLTDGRTITGKPIGESTNGISVSQSWAVDPQTRKSTWGADVVEIKPEDIMKTEASKVSPMTTGLVSMLKVDEIADLVGFLISGGDPNNRIFQKVTNAAAATAPSAAPTP